MTESTFRIKKSRDNSKQELIGGTLDSVHQQVLSKLKEDNLDNTDINKEIEKLESLLNNTSNSLELSLIYKQIQNLKLKLIKNNNLEFYYLKNSDIFLRYYSEDSNIKTSLNTSAGNNSNTFMKFLKSTEQTNTTSQQSRKQIFDEYLSRQKLTDGSETTNNIDIEHCSKCNIAREEHSSEGILICPKCGSEEFLMVVNDFAGFRDPPKERNNYAYKKINHLNEILNQFQAKESTIIPDEIMNEVVCEIKKRRIQNIASLGEKDIREILKKLNRSKYYEHAAHIVSRLNGNPPPTITPEIEEKIRAMFQDIQAPFLMYCPNDRTNFLSYSYILYKFFELLELDEYKIYFPLLKSRDRLISHDQIWEKICEYLKWEFIRSV
jgi:predicted  nucleic acid-binding Zn-ribbon protein